jgi:PAS domain S-box-containing protein
MPPPRVTGIKLDAFVQQARDPVFLLGPDRRIVFVNRAWEQLTGHPAEAVIGQECRPHGPSRPGDLASVGASFCPPPEAMAGQPSSSLTLILHADGELRWRRVEFVPFHNAEGALIGLLGLVKATEAPPQAAESEAHRLRVELLELRERLLARHGFDSLIGRGAEHRRLLDQVTAASSSLVPVLIVGEVGTGKKVVARTIHQRGSRRQAPILLFDCQTLPPEVLERELFGVWASSVDWPVRAPEGATFIIGDILELPRDLQGRLVSALGSRFRLIATTTGDPDAALKAERLRPDLYYALTTLVIRLRPLRERLEDLPMLAQHFLERANLRSERPRDGFTTEALDALASYDWPGNLRELARIIIDQAHGHGDHPMIQFEDIPASIRGARGGAYLPPGQPIGPIPLKEMLTEIERRLIEKALERSGDNKSKAAKLLGVNRPFLYRRLKELGISDEPDPGE